MGVARSLGSCLIVAALAGTAAAHGPKAPAAPPSPAPTAAEAGAPAAAVESFHSALASGDAERALSWLDPEVVIFESGGAEMSREEYAAHHLESDMEFTKATDTEVLDRRVQAGADVAWVLSRTRTTGRFRDRAIDVDGVETMVLRRADAQWRIVHIHWSSGARQAE